MKIFTFANVALKKLTNKIGTFSTAENDQSHLAEEVFSLHKTVGTTTTNTCRNNPFVALSTKPVLDDPAIAGSLLLYIYPIKLTDRQLTGKPQPLTFLSTFL